MTRAFVEPAIADHEPLSERAGVVRIDGHDLEPGRLDDVASADLRPGSQADRGRARDPYPPQPAGGTGTRGCG